MVSGKINLNSSKYSINNVFRTYRHEVAYFLRLIVNATKMTLLRSFILQRSCYIFVEQCIANPKSNVVAASYPLLILTGQWWFQIIENTGFEFLPVTTNQILINAELPFHHHDPFDRIIIAQAIYENLEIVSNDKQFIKYNVPLVWEK